MAKPELVKNSTSMRDEAATVLEQAGLGTLDDYDVVYESPGQKSIVLFSKHNAEDVVKISLSSNDPALSRIWRKAFISETETLQQLDALNMQSVDIPVVKAIGHDPDYILMTRLGPNLKEIWQQNPPDKKEVMEVGRAVAEFVVELREKARGMVHQDLHFANFTRQPDGRYGCLDFEACSPGSCETAFIRFAMEETNILPAASRRIHALTGKCLDAEKLRQEAITTYTTLYCLNDPKVIATIEKNCNELAKASPAPLATAKPAAEKKPALSS